jgi:selenide,water dikinase
VLRPLQDIFPAADYPDLIVGLGSADDAAIWRLDESRALAVTTDFFTPVVDDAYDYGAIAAANALSDLYAMGATPMLALNIAAVPPTLPAELVVEIIRGGAEKVREAGAVIAGGHTIRDDEPKYGLVALGLCDTDRWMTKSAARPGDVLLLTKPLGTGVTTTALKRQQTTADDLAEAVGWMKRLNRDASRLAVELGVRAATDVTGFSLLGHGYEVAAESGVSLEIHLPSVPFLHGARRYAELGCFAGGTVDNRDYFQRHVRFDPTIDEEDRMLLFDAQTSGGLLLSMHAEKAAEYRARAQSSGITVWPLGKVVDGEGITVFDTPFEG